MNWKFVRNVLLKAFALFVVFNLIVIAFSPFSGLGRLSLYNGLFPGRERFPFGQNPQLSYNLTVNDLDTLLASHVVVRSKPADEYRVFILGDSSAWGTLLRPEETLAGQLNALQLHSADGRRVVFYNLAYPTLALWKDVLILDAAMRYQPDLILWPLTLESFPGINPEDSPLLSYNIVRLNDILTRYGLPPHAGQTGGVLASNFLAQRRSIADWYRLQLYGVLWAATGIDQDYAVSWTPARRDFAVDDDALNSIPRLQPDGQATDLAPLLDLTPLQTGLDISGDIPVILLNEPIMISSGENHDVRYNAYYPVWAYDQYRSLFTQQCAAQGWTCLDAWDLVPEDQFTNSAIHMTPAGDGQFALFVAEYLASVGLVTK
jgi:hypothetical protein